MEDLMNTLNSLYWDKLKEEGIEKDDIELVDLDIAFSPVTPMKGEDPCEATETVGGKYIVHHPLYSSVAVTAEALKVMRFRYLQFDPQRVKQRNQINRMFGK